MNNSNSILQTNLPNGKDIFYHNIEEVEFLYEQMPNYLIHGISLKKGDTVFDVGANIGMFSLMCSSVCDNELTIYAFEPIPQIFQILELNMNKFNSENVYLHNCGLSDISKDAVDFQYYPKASGFSTMYFNEYNEFKKYIGSIMLEHENELPPSTKKGLNKVPKILKPLALNLKLGQALKPEIVTSNLKTISQIISQHKIEKIDLLKIDVEKSEYSVLLGIEAKDWSKIEQIVIETHDIQNRVKKIEQLLSNKGFTKITVEQEKMLVGTEYFNIYATR